MSIHTDGHTHKCYTQTTNTHTHTHTHTHTYTLTHTHTHTHTHTNTRNKHPTRILAYIRTHTHACTQLKVTMLLRGTHTQIHTHTQKLYVHTRIHTHKRTHTFTHKRMLNLFCKNRTHTGEGDGAAAGHEGLWQTQRHLRQVTISYCSLSLTKETHFQCFYHTFARQIQNRDNCFA
jgi:hypothetical protein